MKNNFKETNSYKFFKDLVFDVTEDYRTNMGKEYNFDKTIDNLMEDDNFWQMLTDFVWKNLVEIKKEEESE